MESHGAKTCTAALQSGGGKPSKRAEETGKNLTASDTEQYKIHCVNNTDENYYFGVYQDFPKSPGLQSVAWQVRKVAKRGSHPTRADVDWVMEYGITLTDWDENLDKFTGTLQEKAELGNEYQAISDGEFQVIDPNPTGQTSKGQVVFRNNTKNPYAMDLNMGFTIDSKIIASKRDVHPNEFTLFDVHPQYFVACFRKIELGQLVDSGIALGPLEVQFVDGSTTMTVEALIDGGEYKLVMY